MTEVMQTFPDFLSRIQAKHICVYMYFARIFFLCVVNCNLLRLYSHLFVELRLKKKHASSILQGG